MHVSAILVAAGKGRRLNSRVPKPLVKINRRPLMIHSLLALERCRDIKEIIVVANRLNRQGIARSIKKYRIAKVKDIVLGGRLRQDSVWRGLNVLDRDAELVLVHDAARPFIDKRMLSAVINAAKKEGAAILGVPVKSTIKEVVREFKVKKTLNRENLWEIQTPQVFRKELLLKAYEKYKDEPATDDAALVEKLGKKISVIMGSCNNIKVTTPEDLILAQAIAKNLKCRK